MNEARVLLLLVALFACAPGCGGEEPTPDGSTGDGSTGQPCSSQSDCDDELFCNGAESCDPASADADTRGCVPATPPCGAGTCDEAADACGDCTTDADGDGHISVACGGDDCDDANANRYPGNAESCDAENVDEDCDLSTIAGVVDGDTDVDGFVSATCCNVLGDGELRCGPDCDDTRANVRPGVAEVCDPDALDENCSGEANEDCTCSEGDSRACSEAGATGACGLVRQACVGGTWPDDCPTSTGDEVCEGSVDEDCDGEVDEGFMCCEGETRDCGDFCSTDAVETCSSSNEWGTCGAAEVCNYCDDNADGVDDDRALAVATTVRNLLTVGTGYGTTHMGRIFDFTSPSNGAYGLDESSRVRLGYGTVTLSTSVQPECSMDLVGGWSSWILRANAGDNTGVSPLVGVGFNGEPAEREGYMMTRLWESARAFSNVRIGSGRTMMGFGGGGYDDTGECSYGAEFGDGYPPDGQRIDITPDDPATAADELEVCGYIVGETGTAQQIGCCAGFGTGVGECPTRLEVGDFVVAGLSAAKAASSGSFRLEVLSATYNQAATCMP
ncbi:MAG: putative metal-binding motif-containing protein [Sandaracinaceae bacterium]